MTLAEWLECPACESGNVSVSFNNGRLHVACDDCYAATSRLVGRSSFR